MKKLTRRQVAALPEEKRIAYMKKLKRVQRNRKILAVFISLIVVVAVAGALSVTVLFNIKSINVKSAGSHYTKEEIISASGLDVGDNLIRTDFDAVSDRICKNLPYVLSVKISKSLVSGTVDISVTDGKKAMIFKSQSGYAVCDNEGKTLEIIADIPKDNNLIIVVCNADVKAEIGKKIGFANDNEKEVFDSVISAIKESGIKDITKIDISDINSIKIDYQNRFRLLLGANDQLTEKLLEAIKVIAAEDETDDTTIAEIDLVVLKKVYVNPKDYLDKPPVTEPVEETTAEAEEPDSTQEEEESDSEEDEDYDSDYDEYEEDYDEEDE